MAFNKEKVMDAARKFVDKGQIDKAVKEYLRIVHEDPKDVRVWLKIGDLYAKKGSKQDAIETYLKVARFYHEQGFFLKAVAVYKQILKIDPRLNDVILKLAELYRQLGLMSDAMQHFETVAAHFHRDGNTKEALATVKKLVDLDPENIATRIKLAELYSKEGLVEEAAAEFKLACDQLRRQGRQDDFVKVAERLLWHKPDNHPLNRELAGLYLRRNDPRRALQKLQACFKADPRDVETLALLAQAFQALDQKAKTVSVLKELAKILIENKQRDKAAEVYRKIVEFVPTDQESREFLGLAAPAPQRDTPPPPARPLTVGLPAAAIAPPPPPTRPLTPMPASVRGATSEPKFGITGDLPAMTPASARMTGSMPLVDEKSLSGVDFALPEYDDADFSADMEPAPDPRQMSAAGERHAEEISKILAETDVYVKYGLHQKAVDHLRRVFSLDPENVEAHERLKDIFVSQGREQEAEVELLKLAELVASGDPDRAEAYLQELLAMNGTHTGAFELARRFRLRVARMNSSVSSEVDYGGHVAAIDHDDDLDLVAQPARARAVGVARAKRDSVDEFDPDELIGGGRVAHGSPTPQRLAPPAGYVDHNPDLEFEPMATRQVSAEHMKALAKGVRHAVEVDAELDDPVIVDRPDNWHEDQAAATRFEPHDERAFRAIQEHAIEAQLDEAEQVDDEIAAELAGGSSSHLDMPFDPAEARAFDAAVRKTSHHDDKQTTGTDAVFVSGFEETALPVLTDTRLPHSYEDATEDPLAVSGSYDPYGTEAVQTPPYDPNAHVIGHDEVAEPPRAETSVEDELDEADFYVGQGMYAEALEVLRGVLERYPSHRLVNVKYREVEGLLRGHDEALAAAVDDDLQLGHVDHAAPYAPGHGAHYASAHESVDHTPQEAVEGTDAIDLDDIEELDEFDELAAEEASSPAPAGKKRQPTVMLEKPVDEGDAETHYDLGLAYKEMGLYDEAVKAFEKVLRAPGREVQTRVMIGMCHREQGNASEAILQFKAGLHAEPSERERQSLYYEIGQTYEAMGDEAEALYYFEMVMKRDPAFADAAARAAQLRARVGRGVRPVDDDL